MKQTWPAATRNAEPIVQVLRRVLPTPSSVLEIASGTGQHAAHFCQAMPSIQWQPSDQDPDALPSIDAWRRACGAANCLQPLQLDVCDEEWPIKTADSVFCANMIHIAPWRSCLGLLRGASRVLPSRGALILYGPFREADIETAPTNEAFDQSLKSRDPEWGLRNLEDVQAAAEECGLEFDERVQMPANNLMLVFRRK